MGTDIFGSSALVAGFVDTETTATAQVAQTLLPLHTETDTFVTETDTFGNGTFVS